MVGQAQRSVLPTPRGHTTPSSHRPVFWLAFILFCQPSRVRARSGVKQSRLAYSSGGCAGMVGESVLPTSPDFPFHLPRRRGVGTRNGAKSNRMFSAHASALRKARARRRASASEAAAGGFRRGSRAALHFFRASGGRGRAGVPDRRRPAAGRGPSFGFPNAAARDFPEIRPASAFRLTFISINQ